MALAEGGYVQLKASQAERFTALYLDAHREAFAMAASEHHAAITIQRCVYDLCVGVVCLQLLAHALG